MHRKKEALKNAPPSPAFTREDLLSALPTFDPQKAIATRAANGAVMNALAEVFPALVGGSADLEGSNKTGLKKYGWISADDFSGRNFHWGVRELAMTAIVNGLTAYEDLRGFGATFFVFSDYCRPAIRLAAIMEVPSIFVFSHDSFYVGEDGPTHEPVEQEAQIRLMEKLKNHKGRNSMMVLRPADVEETTIAWKLAMENIDSPTGLILSRQNINNLPEGTDYAQAAKGAYIVKDEENADVIMVASGSEVSTLVAGAELLAKDGIKTRIVSVPSEGLFRSQSKEYQESILPTGAKIFGLTAGIPANLQGLVGVNGKIWGLESFGFSAPFKVLDEKLGFNAENVYNQVKSML
mgnify:CR=1 FL=1